MTPKTLHLVLVTTDDREQHVWLAATPEHEAVSQVLDAEGWAARLLQHRAPQAYLALNIAPGEVRQLLA